MTELIQDIHEVSLENGLQDAIIKHTGDNVWKWYMNNLSKEVDQLDLECLFLNADEVVYSKLMMIK